MKLLERIRRFWRPQPAVDHPLSEEEREARDERDRTDLAYDERSRTFEGLVGDDFDPDARL